MTYKVIDDDTALSIYEAIQETSERSFGQYNRMRQLPRTKISGEIVFYLDALLDFSTKVLGRDSTETLQEVIDSGVISWFSNLDPELQKKVGFVLADDDAKALSMPEDDDMDAQENMDTIDALSEKVKTLETALDGIRNENDRLAKELETVEIEKLHLKREVSNLEQINEELMEKGADGESLQRGPAFLSEDAMNSVYTEMTTHFLAQPSASDKKQSGGKKKNLKKKKRNNPSSK